MPDVLHPRLVCLPENPAHYEEPESVPLLPDLKQDVRLSDLLTGLKSP